MKQRQNFRRVKVFVAATLAFVAGSLANCSLDKSLVTRPAEVRPFTAPQAELIAEGARLWKDTKLSSGGDISCNTCHINFSSLNESFAQPYPHKVEMVESKTGISSTTAEQMVQFCLLMPMGREKPLEWDSRELAALTAFTLQYQKDYLKARTKK